VHGVYWIVADNSTPGHPRQPVLAPSKPVALGSETGVPAEQVPMIPLAIVLCPRGGHALYADLLKFRRAGIDVLVSMLSDDQIDMLELQQEALTAKRLGMDFLHHPVPDHHIPGDPRAFRAFVNGLAQRLRDGHRIGIHCWGSIGRAPLTTACTLIHLGWKPQAALAAIEAARGCEVPETEEQKQWVLNYQASL
jgi:protein-tyrosine phosphatase